MKSKLAIPPLLGGNSFVHGDEQV